MGKKGTGPRKGMGPQRSCVCCRKTQDKREFLRIVTDPGGEWVVDWRHRLPGRGAYLCPEPSCVAGAVERGGLRHALSSKKPAAGDDLMNQVRDGFGARVLRMVGMATRSEGVARGRDAARDVLFKRRAFMAIMACDASGRTKRCFRSICTRQGIHFIELFDKKELGRATSRNELAVLAILSREIARKIELDSRMYLRFSAGGGIHG